MPNCIHGRQLNEFAHLTQDGGTQPSLVNAASFPTHPRPTTYVSAQPVSALSTPHLHGIHSLGMFLAYVAA